MTDYTISSGATASYSVNSGDVLQVLSAGESDGSRVHAGGLEIVSAGATASNDKVTSQGLYVFDAGATASDVIVASGGVLDLANAQVASGATLTLGTKSAMVSVSGVSVHDGAAIWSLDTEVMSDGRQIVGSGGIAFATSVDSGGEELVRAGAIVEGASIAYGGALDGPGSLEGAISDGGVVLQGTALSGASLDVLSGAEASLVGLTSGATADIAISGGLNSATLSSGAALTVEGNVFGQGGEALNLKLVGGSVLDDGELLYTDYAPTRIAGTLSGFGSIVQDGPGVLTLGSHDGQFVGTVGIEVGTVLANVKAELGTADIDFLDTANTATLELGSGATAASGSTFANALENFEQSYQQVDLASVAFTSGATATVSGSDLTLADGAYTASFVLSGATAASYVVESDGNSGTLIHAAGTTDAAAPLVEAAAGFGSPATSPTSPGLHADREPFTATSLSPTSPHTARA